MNYRHLTIKGINPETKRKKTKIIRMHYSLQPDQNSIQRIIGDELVAPFEWVEIPHPPALKHQLLYARELGVPIPANPTKDDLSALISKKLSYDREPNAGLLEFANNHSILFSEFIGKKALYNKLFRELPLIEKVAFFCFSIYRFILNDRHANLDDSPHKELFYSFARKHEKDYMFVSSMRGYSGQSIRFFGTLAVEKKTEYYTPKAGVRKHMPILL